ncbi:MAG: Eco57I restriction-modification methylase domain-containing protein [Phycisphaerales bacterium]|jgi:hypothetical protein
MPAPKEVKDLVARFAEHIDAYKRGNYNETQLRREFLDPFFGALGWDVFNEKGYAGSYKDVVHEAALRTSGTTQAPDYSFRIGGQRKFFVEAKKPSVDVKGERRPAYQLRSYAWTAKLPLSILTDFEEFAVYDCKIKPKPNDTPATARLLYITYDEYDDRWHEIASVFAKSSILRGAFDKYATKTTGKRGTTEPDDDFLKLLESWRAKLAQALARNNSLSTRQLNHAVQLIIDRIVFLRICEDRGVEVAETLRTIAKGKDVYAGLLKHFRAADAKYNSGLFHFDSERGRDDPDTLTPALNVGDSVLKDIIDNLYYPQSPYAFAVLSADLLGHIYERFLGSVISLSKTGKTAKVETKPEVRKAGGVYYTPTYIVDYIVEQTVGRLLEDRTIVMKGRGKARGPVMNKPLRVLDPACGSGSFLLGAYQRLLDWYLDFYVNNDPESWAALPRPPVAAQTDRARSRQRGPTEDTRGTWALTLVERKRILVSHVFGVDIDSQAVEVSKLSLLLKTLEGVSDATLETQWNIFDRHERALPDLSDNIKCGNSLIGSDFYTGRQSGMFDDEEQYRINAFDWHIGFEEVTEDGGFDAVIGNPPYFNVDDTWGKGDPRAAYLKRAYPHVYRDKTDILFYFLARSVALRSATVMFIVSRAFLEAYKADGLRGFLAREADIDHVIDLRDYNVFQGVGITTAIIKLVQSETVPIASFRRLQSSQRSEVRTLALDCMDAFATVDVPQARLGAEPWVFGTSRIQGLLDKLDNAGDPVDRVLLIGKGMETGRNGVFGKLNDHLMASWGVPEELVYTRARNSDIQRYSIHDSGEKLLYLEEVDTFEELPAAVQSHLLSAESQLKKRAAYVRGDCDWWRYTWPLHAEWHKRRKLYCPYLANENRFAPDFDNRFLGLTDTTVLFDNDQGEDLLYILGILNSRVMTFRFRYIGKLKSGGILEYFWNSVSRLPIRRIDVDDATDVAHHNQMVELVQSMLNMNRRLHGDEGTRLTPQERRVLESRLSATDREIELLVHKLYGLTDEETAIVEEAIS